MILSSVFLVLENLVYSLNYLGIFILMGIESSFIPFPSEVVMIPAGYLAVQGKLNIYLAIFFGSLGTMIGAIINYMIGKHLGRSYLQKHKKILFIINRNHLVRSEKFFKKYGGAATFVGRLIPGIRQYISIPAGFANMKFSKFILYTFLGSFIWISFLAMLGYYVGLKFSLNIVKSYNHYILLLLIISIIPMVILLLKKKKRFKI